MSRESGSKPMDVAVALGAGAAAALLFGVLLAGLSAPKAFDARIATLQQQAERAQALLKPVRDRGPFGPDALCTADPVRQAQALSDKVSGEAAQARLAIDSLDVRPEPAPDVSERVTPVRLRFSVTGPYEGAVGLLAVLARERPQIFVDSLDLTPKVSNVTLSVSGRLFCGA